MDSVPLLKRGEAAIPAGTVIRGFPRIRVAAVNPSIGFAPGVTLIFTPKKSRSSHRPCRITVRSMQINHQPVDAVQPGQACGIELDCPNNKMPERGDTVWLVTPEGGEVDFPPPGLSFPT
ncbi:MAG: hypothetical protein V1668_01420 [Patescibacteria group bacterium]